jgi:hypothetical protein
MAECQAAAVAVRRSGATAKRSIGIAPERQYGFAPQCRYGVASCRRVPDAFAPSSAEAGVGAPQIWPLRASAPVLAGRGAKLP